MRMYCWNPKNQPNKMRMTPQHIHTIPTSCAISPTIPPCFIFSRFCSTEMNSVREINNAHRDYPATLKFTLGTYVNYACLFYGNEQEGWRLLWAICCCTTSVVKSWLCLKMEQLQAMYEGRVFLWLSTGLFGKLIVTFLFDCKVWKDDTATSKD